MARFVGLCLIFALVGCGSGVPEGPPTFPVEGTLKVGGKPLADITVQLIPLDPSKATLGGAGKTDANGAFKILATNGKEGATAGKYKVVLKKAGGMDAAQYAAGSPTGPPKPADLPFPAEYGEASTSTKEIEVTNKKETLNLEL